MRVLIARVLLGVAVDVPEKVMTDGPDSTIQIREDGKGSTADGIDDAPLEVNDDDSVPPRVADDSLPQIPNSFAGRWRAR